MGERKAKYDRRIRAHLIQEAFHFTQEELKEKVRTDPTMKVVLDMNDLDFLKFMMNCARQQAIREMTPGEEKSDGRDGIHR